MRRAARMVAVLALAVLGGGAAPAAEAPAAPAAVRKDWKAEFEDVCAKTQDAMTLSVDELKSLIDRCEALRPSIEALDETQRKVYSRRLDACKNLYVFVLEYKQKE